MLFRKAFSSGSTAWSLDSQADVATTIISSSPISSPTGSISSRNLRSAHQAIRSAGGDSTIGNVIDDVSFVVGAGALLANR